MARSCSYQEAISTLISSGAIFTPPGSLSNLEVKHDDSCLRDETTCNCDFHIFYNGSLIWPLS